MHLYPDNTQASFTTRLDPPIDLQGSYELGLSEISVPRSWLNVINGELILFIEKKLGDGLVDEQIVYMPAGHYDSVAHLVAVMNQQIKDSFKPKQTTPIPNVPEADWREIFFYRREVGKVMMSLPENISINMTKELSTVLGFVGKQHCGGSDVHTYADHVADINESVGNLYVYLSVLEDRIVGDTRAPLLRLVPLLDTPGGVMFQTFNNIQYVPIKFNSFDNITVNIRNGVGKLVPFERGNVVLTLHLRRRGLF